jgi:signal transduction histidine kinase
VVNEPFSSSRGDPPPESRYDLRSGAIQALRALRGASGRWLLPSTWRATVDLVLWLVTSSMAALAALAGGLAAVATVRAAELGTTIRASVVGWLAQLFDVDRRRIAELTGVRIRPLTLPGSGPGTSHSARQRAWAQPPLLQRLATGALIRLLTAALMTGVAVAWWWGTILAAEISAHRLARGWHFPRDQLFDLRPVHVLGVTSLFYWRLSPVGAILLAVAAAAGLLCWPLVPRAGADLDVASARRLVNWLLGRSTTELSREVVRLSETRAQAVTAADDERRRIERDLHDGFQPQLVNLALNLGLARSRLSTDPDGARALLDRAHEDAKQATEDLRNLVRGIHPSVLDERGLDAAFSALAASSRVRVQIDVHLDRRPPRETEGAAYFVVSEAITNVNKHSHAATATITVTEIEGSLRVVVQDDGEGGARSEPGGGLAGLSDRIAGVDGTFSITSPEGGPTWIEARIPCGQ